MRRLFGKKASPSFDEQDQMVIDQMRSAGWDMSQERQVEIFMYFPTREPRIELAMKRPLSDTTSKHYLRPTGRNGSRRQIGV